MFLGAWRLTQDYVSAPRIIMGKSLAGRLRVVDALISVPVVAILRIIWRCMHAESQWRWPHHERCTPDRLTSWVAGSQPHQRQSLMPNLTFYWLYDLPNWLFGVVVVLFFLLYALAGLFTTRSWVQRQHKQDHSHNDIVSYFLAAITVFYGITLGLLAVATWTNYASTQDKVDHEAQVVASLYRDVNSFPDPLRTTLDDDLRAYVREVIDVSWPQQRKGVIPYGSGPRLEKFQADLLLFEPKTEREKIVTGQAYQVFNNLVEARRGRLESVTSGMPGSLWSLVILGGLITLTVTLFFDMPSFRMHFWMTTLLGTLLGLMVFLIGTLDSPFRGKVSIGPGSLERVYEQLMDQHVSAADGVLSKRALDGGSVR